MFKTRIQKVIVVKDGPKMWEPYMKIEDSKQTVVPHYYEL